jgi:hypothetical protein
LNQLTQEKLHLGKRPIPQEMRSEVELLAKEEDQAANPNKEVIILDITFHTHILTLSFRIQMQKKLNLKMEKPQRQPLHQLQTSIKMLKQIVY